MSQPTPTTELKPCPFCRTKSAELVALRKQLSRTKHHLDVLKDYSQWPKRTSILHRRAQKAESDLLKARKESAAEKRVDAEVIERLGEYNDEISAELTTLRAQVQRLEEENEKLRRGDHLDEPLFPPLKGEVVMARIVNDETPPFVFRDDDL